VLLFFCALDTFAETLTFDRSARRRLRRSCHSILGVVKTSSIFDISDRSSRVGDGDGGELFEPDGTSIERRGATSRAARLANPYSPSLTRERIDEARESVDKSATSVVARVSLEQIIAPSNASALLSRCSSALMYPLGGPLFLTGSS